MQTKYGFQKMSIEEFETWIANLKVARTIIYIQQHHTYLPNYSSFKDSNHFEMQKSMKDFHVNTHGWLDIGQQFSTFPDGSILTGRSMEMSPACILGFNAYCLCIENVGNFDIGQDLMTNEQMQTIIRMTAALCKRFAIAVNTDKIVYHHWFNLSTGERNDGTKNNKSCPGTAFFGGNKVSNCQQNFIPKVLAQLNNTQPIFINDKLLKYVCVNSDTLNVRTASNSKSNKAPDKEPVVLGAILRVYKIENDWYKISNTKEHWIAGKYTKEVFRATVNADTLNVRIGPGTSFTSTNSLLKGTEIFIQQEKDGWCKISLEEKWVKKSFLDFEKK